MLTGQLVPVNWYDDVQSTITFTGFPQRLMELIWRAPSAMCQRLRQPRISSSLGSRLSRLSFLSLVADMARCTLSPPSPTPLASPLAPPLVGVCSVPCVTCACGATTSRTACYRMAAGGVLGGDASGAPHVSLMMVPAAPRRIDARGSDSL